MTRRKLAIAVLILSLPGLAQSTYDGVMVRITGTAINQNNMLVISALEYKGRSFVFACSPESTFCSAPEVGKVYSVVSNARRYVGDNYTLKGKGDRIDVFLAEVTQ